ncbi:uncharacterized protein NECHADRAFT_94006 [Fusarium vanettenii 77-13-4]|uniref:Alcohol acetyltransferase n=1 Tax=Fusarium vanettenii (strain ATCC MYA-4622 / CBS 123669 / FGSC 9596 / NRRL 45880 / 77-13-4) TaxID=660122 RepID=C7ZGJ2_FUSV7|nr:uncharacterized protein NECHADRAFT_94006 [Fusarium vanettenii 77-13-4]EEU36901.1 hypothetical protein NECHADRAFT_94006 [Fusarium vanettenii 77-13-4]
MTGSDSNAELPVAKTRLRRLGCLELYQSALHNVRHYCGTTVTCRYLLPPPLASFDMQKEVVRKFENAVAQTILQFPMLQVGLVGESTRRPYWVSLPTIDLADHIHWHILADSKRYDEQYNANLLYQLDAKFEHLETKPGWRLLLMRTETDGFVDAMFVWNHANCDGMSGKIFHLSLLESLDRPTNWGSFLPDSSAIPAALTAQDLPLPQEKLAKHPITLGFAFSQVWHTFGPSLLSSKSAKATWAPLQLGSYASQTTSFSIQNAALCRILGACRQHGTTLTGLLHGIILACLACYVPEKKARAFTASTAMDQRRFMYPEKGNAADTQRKVQNCVSTIHHTFDSDLVADIRATARANNWENQPVRDLEREIWSASRISRGDIEERLNAGLKNNIVGLMKLVHDWQEYHGDQAKRDRELSWIVTNLGVIDGEGESGTDVHDGNERWSINQANFALSAHLAGPFVQVSALSVKGQDLCISLSWQDSDEGNEICAQLAQGMEAWLGFLGQSDM